MRRDPWEPVPPGRVPSEDGGRRPEQTDRLSVVDDGTLAGHRVDALAATGVVAASGVSVTRSGGRGMCLAGVTVAGWHFRDVAVEATDLAGAVAERLVVQRARLAGSRFRDASAPAALLVDVIAEDCTAGGLVLRFARLRRVTFRACDLQRADLTGAELDHVTFDRCDLTGARFDNVAVTAARFRNCRLYDVSGALSLRGVRLSSADLVTLAPSLARELGMSVTDDTDAGGAAPREATGEG